MTMTNLKNQYLKENVQHERLFYFLTLYDIITLQHIIYCQEINEFLVHHTSLKDAAFK